jgi:pyruvate dehydrogenase E1 component alpha subunit
MPVKECRPNDEIFRIAEPFDIHAERIDGNDVLEVYETSQRAIDRCRHGKGPFFIECLTYRLRGHVGPDDNIQGTHTDIRPDEEVAFWKSKDPIINFEKLLFDNQIIGSDSRNTFREKIGRELATAHEAANICQYPSRKELFDYVFSK